MVLTGKLKRLVLQGEYQTHLVQQAHADEIRRQATDNKSALAAAEEKFTALRNDAHVAKAVASNDAAQSEIKHIKAAEELGTFTIN